MFSVFFISCIDLLSLIKESTSLYFLHFRIIFSILNYPWFFILLKISISFTTMLTLFASVFFRKISKSFTSILTLFVFFFLLKDFYIVHETFLSLFYFYTYGKNILSVILYAFELVNLEDKSKLLKSGTSINNQNKAVTDYINQEKLIYKCFTCNKIGHLTKNCKLKDK